MLSVLGHVWDALHLLRCCANLLQSQPSLAAVKDNFKTDSIIRLEVWKMPQVVDASRIRWCRAYQSEVVRLHMTLAALAHLSTPYQPFIPHHPHRRRYREPVLVRHKGALC